MSRIGYRASTRRRLRAGAVQVLTASRLAPVVGGALLPRNRTAVDCIAGVTLGTLPRRGDDIAVLAHFDPCGELGEPAEGLLAGLAEAGLRTVLVSTAPLDRDAALGSLGSSGIAVVTRPNAGFDFGSWAAGIRLLEEVRAEPRRLVLVNSSMYGPLTPLAPVLDRLYATGADVLGLTESREFIPHLQSYFLGFTAAAWRSDRFHGYWRRIRPSTTKWGTILAHEIRWAGDLAQRTDSGLRPGVIATAARVGAGVRNPLTFTWRQVVSAGVPFIKRSLFLHNTDRVDLHGWADFLRSAAPGFDTGVIARDVARYRGRLAPDGVHPKPRLASDRPAGPR